MSKGAVNTRLLMTLPSCCEEDGPPLLMIVKFCYAARSYPTSIDQKSRNGIQYFAVKLHFKMVLRITSKHSLQKRTCACLVV